MRSACYARQEPVHGRRVETSLFDALAEWMGYPSYYTLYGGSPPARAGVRHATVVPYGSYRCGDGQAVLLAVQTEAQWSAFCRVVCEHSEWERDPRFATPPGRRINRDALEAAIEDAFAAHPRTEVTRRLEAADVPYGDLNEIEQFLDHPQLVGRDRWREVDSPSGPLRAILPPMGLEGFEPRMCAIPDVGQHTAEVLRELGYDDAAIADLRATRAV